MVWHVVMIWEYFLLTSYKGVTIIENWTIVITNLFDRALQDAIGYPVMIERIEAKRMQTVSDSAIRIDQTSWVLYPCTLAHSWSSPFSQSKYLAYGIYHDDRCCMLDVFAMFLSPIFKMSCFLFYNELLTHSLLVGLSISALRGSH